MARVFLNFFHQIIITQSKKDTRGCPICFGQDTEPFVFLSPLTAKQKFKKPCKKSKYSKKLSLFYCKTQQLVI